MALRLARRARVLAAVLLTGLCFAAFPPMSGAEPRITIRGAPGAGPAAYDEIHVERFGDSGATRVLVLVPSIEAGAGQHAPLARTLVERVADLQVWAVEPRWQAFEDGGVFATGDPDAAFAYYLRFEAVAGRRFQPVSGPSVPFVRRWGLALYMEDLRRVVLAARAGGNRKVLLGGRSFGANLSAVYASWDFDGRPGWRDLEALMLLDASISPDLVGVSRRSAQASLTRLRSGDPFVYYLRGLPPWAPGVFLEVGALYAKTRPDEASILQNYPLIPPAYRPADPVTNKALVGFALDRETTPGVFANVKLRAGRLAPGPGLRGWVDGELSPLDRVAAAFSSEPTNAWSWYPPKRLNLDMSAAVSMTRTPASKLLRLRTWHLRSLALPVYALQTAWSRGYFLHNIRVLQRLSNVPKRKSMLIDASASMDSLDPLLAAPERNPLPDSLGKFIRRLARR